MMAPPELEKVHPLGKSPVVTVTAPGSTESVVLAESGFIFQYLCDHFAQNKNLVPKRWKDGQEGKVLGETEAWMRYQYLLYYAEGSFMPNLVQYIVISGKVFFGFFFFVFFLARISSRRHLTGLTVGSIEIKPSAFPDSADHERRREQGRLVLHLPQHQETHGLPGETTGDLRG